MKKKNYENPTTIAVEVHPQMVLLAGSEAKGGGTLGGWRSSDGNSWSGDNSSSSGSSMGGWTDSGSDAWE